jgi:hypothetical protein
VKGRKVFFSEKNQQKLLIISGSVYPAGAGPDLQKFFGSFFQNRTAFCHLPSHHCFTRLLCGTAWAARGFKISHLPRERL